MEQTKLSKLTIGPMSGPQTLAEVVSFFVEFEAAVPRLTPAFW
jgi:hypothetical protein